MKLTDSDFVQGFIALMTEAYAKNWHERNGGNLSYRLSTEELAFAKNQCAAEIKDADQWTPLGISVPVLANECFLVTGSGKYFKNVRQAPAENLGIVQIDDTGERYSVIWGFENGGRPTSELPAHLANHASRKKATNGRHRVMYHAHLNDMIALTFVLPLCSRVFSREIWSAITECPVVVPEGVGVLPLMTPGSREIAEASGQLMEQFSVVVWAHHGVFCSGTTFDDTFGLMETVDKASGIVVKVLSMGGKKNDMTPQHLKDFAGEYNLTLNPNMLD